MSRIRTLLLLIATCTCLAVSVAGCGGGEPADDDVVARATPDTAAPESDLSVSAAPDDVSTTSTALRDANAGPSSADPGIVVDVAGAVQRPGVYRMSPGARVHEAIQAAGGARRGASLGALNRAAVLVDGQQVLVGTAAQEGGAGSATGSGGGAGVTTGAGAGAGGMVNVNSADVAGLDALPGVGQVTAERIVASRDEAGPFASLDDLDRVPGIGPGTIESLRAVATT